LVVREASEGVVGPPRASISPQLLYDKEGLLMLRAVQEPKLGLDHPKPMVGLQKLSCLGKDWQMGSREVSIGGRS
jgi:hypothetical protein